MQEENQVPSQPTPQPEEKASGKDYLAPALVFIALFFSFFVLITMQRLTRKAVGGDQVTIMPTPQPITTMETTPSPELTAEEQAELDSQKDVDEVGNDIIKDIDNTTSTDVEGVYDERELDELEEN